MNGPVASTPVESRPCAGPARPAEARDDPLVVDLDGTLLRTDLLYETFVLLLRHRPWCLFLIPFWLARGKARLKREIALRVDLDAAGLPANDPLVAWLLDEKARGRRLALVSASDELLVRRVADRFEGLFDVVRGSDGVVNLAGERKLAAIRAQLGPVFTYVGDGLHDVPVWEGCGSAVLSGRTDRLRGRLSAAVTVVRDFPTPPVGPGTWMRALRLHQWAKNALLFVPALLAGRLWDPHGLAIASLGFVAFGVLASASYLLNDLLDLGADRLHRSKRHRPLAAGELPLRSALLAIPAMGGMVALLLAFLPIGFAGAALLYLAVTLAYSFALKREPILDLVILAFLFTLRILAGTVVLGLPISPWLLTFSMFFFLSLAAIKRYTECLAVAAEGRTAIPARGYRTGDAPLLMALGVSVGFCSTLVFFIFLVDTQIATMKYAHPEYMWFICLIIGYWLGRAWLLAVRDEMHGDPVLFAVKDPLSVFLGALTAVLVLLARPS